MADAVEFAAGGYRFIPSVFQYSAGVAAQAATRSSACASARRCRWRRALRASSASSARPAARSPRSAPANCVRLRPSPKRGSARSTRSMSSRWRNGACSTARPTRSRAATSVRRSIRRRSPSFHAFSLHRRGRRSRRRRFVIAGGAEAREGGASYQERTIRRGETSADAMREKAQYVLGEMERRLGLARLHLGRHHGDAGLHRAGPLSVPRGRDRAPRRRARRPHLALRAPAGGGARIRDGLPRRRHRAGDLIVAARRRARISGCRVPRRTGPGSRAAIARAARGSRR